MTKRKVEPNSTLRGEHGLRSDTEWQRMIAAMKRIQYSIIAPITGATFTKLQKFTPSTEHVSFEGDYDLMLPDVNIILWRGISYLAGEALIELNVEGSIIVEPCARMLYNFDELHNGAMDYPPAKIIIKGQQPQLSWMPLAFWTPEMHRAMATGEGRSNKRGAREALIHKYEDEGREIWRGVKMLEGAQLVRTPEVTLLSRAGHEGENLQGVRERLEREGSSLEEQSHSQIVKNNMGLDETP